MRGCRPCVLVIGTFRDSEVHHGGALAAGLAALHREQGVQRIAVRGLGDADMLDLLETVAGHEMQASGVALRDALLAETEGNPFFVTELLRHLSETGGIYQDDTGVWRLAVDLDRQGLPVSIREVVGNRVNRLGPETERALTIAAVIGRDFDIGLLAQVAELSEDHLLDLCDAAVDAAVLRETDVADRYTFAHALIERSLHDGLSAARLARAHRAVAEAIEERCGADPGDRVGELAHHWAQATRPQDTHKAVHFAGLAGERALRQLAPAEAVRWFTDALAHLAGEQLTSPAGIALRIGLGEAQRLEGDPAHRDVLLDAARDAADGQHTDLLVRAALANNGGKASSTGEVDGERLDTARAALAALDPTDSVDRALLLALLAAELTFDPSGEAPAIATEAVAMARRLNDPRTFISVVASCKEPRSVCDTLAQHLVDAADAVRLADESGDAVLGALAHWAAVTAAIDAGDRDGVDRHTNALEAYAERTGLGDHRAHAAHFRATHEMFDGDLDRMDAAIAAYLDVGISGGSEQDTITQWSVMMLFTGWVRGELGGMIPAIEAECEAQPLLTGYTAVLAWAQAHDGRLTEATKLLQEARRDRFAIPRDFLWLSTQCLWVEAAARVGDAATAQILAPRIEPWGDLMASSHASATGIVWHYAGRARSTLGEHDLAVAHLEQAVNAHRGMRAPFFLAMSEVALAEALAARDGAGDLARARELATIAHEVATARGYGYIRRDAAAVLTG